MSEKGLWAATSRTDVLFSIVQVALKGSLACLGWYTALTLPPLFTEAGALTLPPTPLSPLIFGLFALCTALDAFWHRRGLWSEAIHHGVVTIGLVWTFQAGGLAHVFTCLNGVQETVGPIYQAIKLTRNSPSLLRLAVATNVLVRAPYWLIMMGLLARQAVAAHGGRDPDRLFRPALSAFLFAGYATGLGLDFVWTSKMVRRLRREAKRG